jgi:hypothetical protein
MVADHLPLLAGFAGFCGVWFPDAGEKNVLKGVKCLFLYIFSLRTTGYTPAKPANPAQA